MEPVRQGGMVTCTWTNQPDKQINLTVALDVVQEETGVADIWLTASALVFRNVPALDTPLFHARLEGNSRKAGRGSWYCWSASARRAL